MILSFTAVIAHAALRLRPTLDQTLHINGQPFLVTSTSQPQIEIIDIIFLSIFGIFALVISGCREVAMESLLMREEHLVLWLLLDILLCN